MVFLAVLGGWASGASSHAGPAPPRVSHVCVSKFETPEDWASTRWDVRIHLHTVHVPGHRVREPTDRLTIQCGRAWTWWVAIADKVSGPVYVAL